MQRRTSGFTLIELLVVIAIIAILAAILFPVFAQAREKARQASCISNNKQIGNAIMMYTQDYDEFLPQTGWQGPCTNPIDVTQPNDAYWSGTFAFPLATYPYTKNWQIWSCPSDPYKGGWGKQGSYCYEAQLLAVNMPGSYSGMRSVANAMTKSFPLSYAGNYWLNKVYLGRGTGFDMYNLAGIAAPSNLFYSTDVGSATNNGNSFAGWYIVPGYGNSTNPVDRWPLGQRHNLGRVWTFVDGHAKWLKDPPLLNGNGSARTTTQLVTDYRLRGVYTDPEWDSPQ